MNLINSITDTKNATEAINNLIYQFENSELRKKMVDGYNYYRSENTAINDRQMLVYVQDENGNPVEMEDPYKANNQLASGFMRTLIDQKINYSLGKKITLDVDNEKLFYETVGKDFQVYLKRLGKEASIKGIGWLHVYMKTDGTLGLTIVPSEQIIPIYKTYDSKELDLIIRYYNFSKITQKGTYEIVTRVEVWDSQQATYYERSDESGFYYLLTDEQMFDTFGECQPNPKYHFQRAFIYGDSVASSEGVPWGKVPFIPLYNNDESDYDLQSVKTYVDAYDIVNSDFINNLVDFQDIYWILKGYDGENLLEFLTQVKRYKTLKVSESGDARAEKLDVPYEARKEAKESLEKDIYAFGMGFNPNQIGDGNITNIVIQSRYTQLDLKADAFEEQVDIFVGKFLYFINTFLQLHSKPLLIIDAITYNRSMMMNEAELLKSNAEQKGVISEQTRLKNHIWVDNVDEEITMMEDEIQTPDLSDTSDLENNNEVVNDEQL